MSKETETSKEDATRAGRALDRNDPLRLDERVLPSTRAAPCDRFQGVGDPRSRNSATTIEHPFVSHNTGPLTEQGSPASASRAQPHIQGPYSTPTTRPRQYVNRPSGSIHATSPSRGTIMPLIRS